ncbi:hypothetical protein NTH45_002785 [Vibrio cholerae]
MERKTKNVKVTFFVTGQDDKRKPVKTPDQFDAVWKAHFLPQVQAKLKDPKFVKKGVFHQGDKNIVLWVDSYVTEADDPYYFGYVGVFRDTTLPTIYDRKTDTDSNIVLSDSDEILEKSYFLYYPTLDLLVFHQNHLGPRADDLAFMLFKFSSQKSVKFESIWKNHDLKAMLEDGSVLKKATLTIALPRSFKETDFDLSNDWSNDLVKMMYRSGMNKLTLQFWGRASAKKGEKGYISDTVKQGFKELVKKYSGGSARSGDLKIKKAEAQMKDGKSESLLSQELSTRMDVDVIGGYPEPTDMAQALIYAKIRCNDELKPYFVQTKASA